MRRDKRTLHLDTNIGQVIAAYGSGTSLADLAEQYGICSHTVRDRLKKHGVAIRPEEFYARRRDVAVGEVRLLYAAGLTTYEIAARLNVTRPTICNRLREAGVDRRASRDYYPGGPFFWWGGGGGYLATTDRERNHAYIHRVCWETYCGPIPKGYVIHHKDGDKTNNSIHNLACLTNGEHTREHMRQRKSKQAELRYRSVAV